MILLKRKILKLSYKKIWLILSVYWFATGCESQYVTEESFKPPFIIYCDSGLDMQLIEFEPIEINPNNKLREYY